MERYLGKHEMAGWVSMPGRVSRDRLRELHWDSDLYLTTARLEAFGIAALEARAAGLAVVARSGTGVEDFVEHAVSGLLAPDDAGLARAVATLAGDPGVRARITTHNRTVPPVQDWPDVVAATVAEYERAIAAKERP
jgi:glycosyltransferase involved in cell wall biosynthesis